MSIRICVWLGCLSAAVFASAGQPRHWSQDVLTAPEATAALAFQVLPAQADELAEILLTESSAELFAGLPQEEPFRIRLPAVGVVAKDARLRRSTNGVVLRTGRPMSTERITDRTLLLLARLNSRDAAFDYECHLLWPDSPHFSSALAHFGLTASQVRAGDSGLDTVWQSNSESKPSAALQKFLPEFVRVRSLGFVPTERRGSTGIGYTFESLLNIEENNSQGGDFLGMELKTHRNSEFRADSSRRMNLFLKEPQWIDGLSHRSRIPKYGYVDDNGRIALYSTVTSKENAHGLSAQVDRERQRVWLSSRGKQVAYWTFEILAGRLAEKLNETAFIGAATRGSGASEEFHYNSVFYCRDPSVQQFVQLLEQREVVIEMRMHLKPEGTARNHGTAFRVRQNRIPRLYAITVQCGS